VFDKIISQKKANGGVNLIFFYSIRLEGQGKEDHGIDNIFVEKPGVFQKK